MNILKDIKNKKTESLNKIIKNKYTLNKKIIGYNQKAYQYSIYYNALKKRILPHINSKSRNIIDKNKTYKSYGVKIKLKPTLQTEI